MPDLDLEKVIEILEKAKTIIEGWVPMFEQYNTPAGIDDAIALLKAQEPVKAVADGEDSYMCNNCGTVIGWAELEPGGIEEVKYKFCPECGRAVKWES